MRMTAQLSRERLEALANLQSLECMALPASHAESAEMARILLAGMSSEPVAVAGFDAATAIRACMDEFPEHVHDIVEECAQIAENTISSRHAAPQAPVAVPDMLWKMEHWRGAPCNGVEWAKGYQAGWNKYHQWLGERRAAMLEAGPVTGWIKCSERMPPSKTPVIVGCWFGRNWATKWATYLPGHEDAQKSGFLMPGGSWTPTHWMPLPAAPEQEV